MGKIFRKAMLSLLTDGVSRTTNMMNEFNALISNIDFDQRLDELNKAKNALIEKSNRFMSDFSDFIKEATNSVNDFTVTIPFDGKRGEKVEYNIEDGNKLVVLVTFESDIETKASKHTFTIPSNCNIESLTETIDEDSKTITITIPKLEAEENANESTPSEGVNASTNEHASEAKGEEATQPSAEKEEGAINDELEKKIEANVNKVRRKLVRDENGKFTIKKPTDK